MNATQPEQACEPIRIGISSCLLGHEVRYDSGHKHNAYITQTLGRFFEFTPFCPEVAIGLGVPRPPIRLVQCDDGVHVRGIRDPERDVTGDLVAYGEQVSQRLDGVSGYLFKKGSPSCGMERVRIYKPGGEPAGVGAGMFAATIMRERPELPVEEEGRLMDAVLRENFVERVFVYHRWQRLCRGRPGAGELVDFHTRHKLIVLSHDETAYRELGRLVAEAGKGDLEATLQHYIRVLMRALKKNATPKQHANILMHILGFFKRQLATADKAELLDLIDAYRRSQVPLVVPITLIKHHLRHYPDDYLSQQYYLNPHPRELMLRNHI
jgi:uncharacterized protein YbgA (DUF1722 family)/uncharacterized protein YbbK (DUF523 family)